MDRINKFLLTLQEHDKDAADQQLLKVIFEGFHDMSQAVQLFNKGLQKVTLALLKRPDLRYLKDLLQPLAGTVQYSTASFH